MPIIGCQAVLQQWNLKEIFVVLLYKLNMVTLPPPTSEIRVRIPAQPQVVKLLVAVYSRKP